MREEHFKQREQAAKALRPRMVEEEQGIPSVAESEHTQGEE